MDVVIAILVKDKEATLPTFITCLLNQTFPKERTRLYIRTNDNTDKSEDILSTFITENGSNYKSVFYDRTSVSEELKQYKAHDWNAQRFKILGKIRDDSVKYALEHKAHYFVIDIDNFNKDPTTTFLHIPVNSKVEDNLPRVSEFTKLIDRFVKD